MPKSPLLPNKSRDFFDTLWREAPFILLHSFISSLLPGRASFFREESFYKRMLVCYNTVNCYLFP